MIGVQRPATSRRAMTRCLCVRKRTADIIYDGKQTNEPTCVCAHTRTPQSVNAVRNDTFCCAALLGSRFYLIFSHLEIYATLNVLPTHQFLHMYGVTISYFLFL